MTFKSNAISLKLILGLSLIATATAPTIAAAKFIKLSTYPISKQITLKWQTIANTNTYRLCYATQPVKDVNLCANYANSNSIDLKKNRYTATQLTDGTTYFFKLAALDSLGQVLSTSKTISSTAMPILNDTGIMANQCYQTASSTLVSCQTTAAKALNSHQDGLVGRDVNPTTNINTDGVLGFTFTKISAAGAELAATEKVWSCIKDNVTGLMWEVKTADGGLRDSAKTYTNYGAGASLATDANVFVQEVNAQGLCGTKDWRLPKVHELQSLINYATAYPNAMIDSAFFLNTRNTKYWSSSPNTDNADAAWNASFSDGKVNNDDKSRAYSVLLVRGTPYTPSTRFTVSADGLEVTDNKNRLIWRRCAEGLDWNGVSCFGTPTLYTHEAALAFAATEATADAKAWRLPDIKEIASLSDIARRPDPAIDTLVFPGTPSERFWSSTPYATTPAFSWYADFYDGYVNFGTRTSSFAVRLVRNQ